MNIDKTTYDKLKLYPPNATSSRDNGFDRIPRQLSDVTTIMIHTTNGKRGTAFSSEANYIYRSRDISAHFLVGKAGQIAQFLPVTYIAWHAGAVDDADVGNAHSIGIECHLTSGEEWSTAQREALTDLCVYLVQTYPSIRRIVTHRGHAIYPSGPKKGQYGRKIDPVSWPDIDFETWVRGIFDRARPPVPATGDTINLTPTIVITDRLAQPPTAAPSQAFHYMTARAHAVEYTDYDIQSIINSYWKWSQLAGVDPVLVLAQMIHETGNLTSWWSARPRRNPAGLGVTGHFEAVMPRNVRAFQYDVRSNVWRQGYAFPSWDHAAQAHVGHVLCYMYTDAQMNTDQRAIVDSDPRKDDVPASYRGSATFLTDLNGKWAVPGTTYGQMIFRIAQGIQRMPL